MFDSSGRIRHFVVIVQTKRTCNAIVAVNNNPEEAGLLFINKMGGIASRRRAGVEEVNVGPNNMYKYPPRSGRTLCNVDLPL